MHPDCLEEMSYDRKVTTIRQALEAYHTVKTDIERLQGKIIEIEGDLLALMD